MIPAQYLLNKLSISVALFDSNAELVFYNKSLIDLLRLPEHFLADKPSIIEFFEVIREKGVMPEKNNFREFCGTIYKIATSNQSHYKKETILLPNGIYLQEILQKEDNFLSITWEDISETSDMVRSLSNYKNLYNRLIEKNPKPLTVIASNGIIESYNSKFLEIFNISSELLDNKIHARELLNYLDFLKNKEEDKALLLGNLVSSRSFNLTIELDKEEKLSVAGIYLQNSNTFIQWDLSSQISNITSEIDPESVLDLHKNLIVDLNHLVGSPVSNIIGFADLLQNEYVGGLNLRQKEYMDKIIEKAEFINSELNHKIELSELENTSIVDSKPLDLNIIISNILYHVKPRLKAKNISVQLDVPSKINTINSDENLINKSFSLLLMYIIEQNNHNSEIQIQIEQSSTETVFTFKDTAKAPLLSNEDLKKRYDINLATSILNKLGFSYDYASKQRSHRYLSIRCKI